MAREVLSNGVINPDKYQADWYADLSNNWNLLDNLIGSAISGSEVDSKIATAIQELMIRTFQIVAELPATGTEGVMYLVLIPDTSKYTAYVWENNAYRELGVIQMTITIDDELSTTSENPVQNKVITNALNNKAPISHTHNASDITSGLATVATSGSYNDLSNKPTIPTVNDATLTIQRNGATVDTFTANSSTDKTVDITVPTKTSDLTNDSNFVPSTDLANVATSGSYNDLSNKPTIPTVNNATLTIQKNGTTVQTFTANQSTNATANITVPTKTSDLTNDSGFITSDNTKIPLAGSNQISGDLIPSTDNSIDIGSSTKNLKMLYTKGITIDGTQFLPSDYVPRSGGGVITGTSLGRIDDTDLLYLNSNGGYITLFGASYAWGQGAVRLNPTLSSTTNKTMYLFPNGTWTWDGTACQVTSDQRYKQQIAEIDDDLLTAWEDVNLVQFKYNDAVKEKSDNARLHTGYVVQQIDEACKKHNVDVSKYGLYCHEEYPEETGEVEHDDGTKTTEVVRPANEYYSLRYTEALIVECAYLRKKLKELTARIEELEKGNNVK